MDSTLSLHELEKPPILILLFSGDIGVVDNALNIRIDQHNCCQQISEKLKRFMYFLLLEMILGGNLKTSSIFRDSEQNWNNIKKIIHIPKGLLQDFRQQQLAQVFPQKPTVINLLINDVCNSRCQMCLIWKNKKSKEFSPVELRNIFEDDLFSDIEYVGVSGGEPTLRGDFTQLFDVICAKSPKLKGVGIITNGISKEIVKTRLLEAADVCKAAGISFNVMFSLDGIGGVHDEVRGRTGNFHSTLSLIKFFNDETDIPTTFGCTVTASNALYVDELLDFAKSEDIYGRFRIAEFIKRLNNDTQSDYIRDFDDKTLYHLGLFFFRLEHDFESSPTFQKTYRNIRSMLTEESERQINCPYQSRAVVLTAKGELLYCSPNSPNLGSALTTSAKKLYFSNIKKREEIVKSKCKDCIHDYHAPITTYEKITSFLEKQRRKKYDCSRLLVLSKRYGKLSRPTVKLSALSSSTVLIVGWYGTETAGDKAILWSVVNELNLRLNPPKKIYLSSLFPFVSQWTVRELALYGIEIVETYTREFEAACRFADEVVVGGGPLMDIEPINHILYAFIQATKNGKVARLEGCGIGPLSDPLYVNVVSELLRLADHITLRDSASVLRGKTDFGRKDIELVSDPATSYVINVKESYDLLPRLPTSPKEKYVGCFVRELTLEYKGDLGVEPFLLLQQKFEMQLVQMLTYLLNSRQLRLSLLPMHTFSVGGDDREFSRKIVKDVLAIAERENTNGKITYARGIVSPLEILQNMSHASFNVCMRFHSVLFAQTLGVPYIAIDYTNGGKIQSYLQDKNAMNRLLTLEDVAQGQWKKKLNECLRESRVLLP